MVSQLTRAERYTGLTILLALAAVGLAMAAVGGSNPFGAHGWIVLFASSGLAVYLMGRLDSPEPSADRLTQYYDDPIKVGIALTMVWAIFGMGVGVWVAAELAWPQLNFDSAWLSFGRLRPAHTTGVIFGFGVFLGLRDPHGIASYR